MFLKNFKKNNEKSAPGGGDDKQNGHSKILAMIEVSGKIDLKRLKSNHVVDLVKKYKSLEEQNKHLSKYLQEMVKENENL
jgi:hypothetical protein